MLHIRTNRELYVAIAKLIEEHRASQRDLEEYLRTLWKGTRTFSIRPSLSADEFFGALVAAFTSEAPEFDENWRSIYDRADTMSDDFAGWEACILCQIVDLREMAEQNILENEWRYFGIKSPRGSHWVNFDPCTFLECATTGCFGGWQPGDETGREYVPGPVAALDQNGNLTSCDPTDVYHPVDTIDDVTWETFRDFLESGQWYE